MYSTKAVLYLKAFLIHWSSIFSPFSICVAGIVDSDVHTGIHICL